MRLTNFLAIILFAFQFCFAEKVPWEFDDQYDPVSYKKELLNVSAKKLEINRQNLEDWSTKSNENWNLIREYGEEILRAREKESSWGTTALPVFVGGTGLIMYSVYSDNLLPALLTLLGLEIYAIVELASAIDIDNKAKDRISLQKKTDAYYRLKRAYFYSDYESSVGNQIDKILENNRQRIGRKKQDSVEDYLFTNPLEFQVKNQNIDSIIDDESCTPRHPTFPSIRKRNALRMKKFLEAPTEELPQIDNWRRELEAFTITQTMANHPVPVLLDTDYDSYKQNAIWKTIAGASIASLGVLWLNSEVDRGEYSYDYERNDAEENKNLWAGITTLLGVSYAIKHSFRIGSYDDLSKRQAQYKKTLKTSYQNYKTDHQDQQASATCRDKWIEAKDVSREYYWSENNSWAGFNIHYMQKPLSQIGIFGGQYTSYSQSDTLVVSESIMHQQFQIKAYHARKVSPKAHYPALWLLYYLPGYIDFMLLQDHQSEHWKEASTIYKTYKKTLFTPVDIIDKTHLLDWEAIQ